MAHGALTASGLTADELRKRMAAVASAAPSIAHDLTEIRRICLLEVARENGDDAQQVLARRNAAWPDPSRRSWCVPPEPILGASLGSPGVDVVGVGPSPSVDAVEVSPMQTGAVGV